jgi:hypothetical protein
MLQDHIAKEKEQKFREQAEKQRKKIKDLKANGDIEEEGSPARSGPDEEERQPEYP